MGSSDLPILLLPDKGIIGERKKTAGTKRNGILSIFNSSKESIKIRHILTKHLRSQSNSIRTDDPIISASKVSPGQLENLVDNARGRNDRLLAYSNVLKQAGGVELKVGSTFDKF
jgi:hypothetical protein